MSPRRVSYLLAVFSFLFQNGAFAQPIPMTGNAGAGLEAFDAIIQKVLADHRIPGAGFALARGGRLVLARGYGFANLQSGELVQPSTGFLLASVSKSITAAAILGLVQQGRLRLDQKAFDILAGIEPLPGTKVDPRLADITVAHLLHHEGGWDRRKSGDPMTFQRKVGRALSLDGPMGPADLARYMVGQKLDFAPGRKAVYSSFGYMLLGMIVERVANEPYVQYVQRTVLEPVGMTAAHESSGHRDYFPDETRRYGPRNRMGPGGTAPVQFASGGWIASAVDMARFITAIDGSRPPPLLDKAATEAMFAPPHVATRPNGHFGMGWDVVQETHGARHYWKNGSLLGTTAWLEHGPDGVDWALLLNASVGKTDGPDLSHEFVDAIRTAIDATSAWPDVDLFREFS